VFGLCSLHPVGFGAWSQGLVTWHMGLLHLNGSSLCENEDRVRLAKMCFHYTEDDGYVQNSNQCINTNVTNFAIFNIFFI
jgi:hypothetical protein